MSSLGQSHGQVSSSRVSRVTWSPLLVKIGDCISTVIIWKDCRGILKIYQSNWKKKDTIFGNLKQCVLGTDGEKVQLTDDLGQTVKLRMDVSLMGDSNSLSIKICSMRASNKTEKVWEYLSSFCNEENIKDDQDFSDFKKTALDGVLHLKEKGEILVTLDQMNGGVRRKEPQEKLSKQARMEKYFEKEVNNPKGFDHEVKSKAVGRIDVVFL